MIDAGQVMLRVDQVAERLGVSVRVASDLMQEMPRVNIGRSSERPRWAVDSADLDAWIKSRKVQPVECFPSVRRRMKHLVSVPGLLDETGHIARRK